MIEPKPRAPLWVISFDQSLKGKTEREKAVFCISLPNDKTVMKTLSDDEAFALKFLEAITSSFKEMTEPVLEDVEQDETKKAQAEEIRNKFRSLDLWIKWLRKWQQDNPS